MGWQAVLDALGVASFLFCTGGDSADARVEWSPRVVAGSKQERLLWEMADRLMSIYLSR